MCAGWPGQSKHNMNFEQTKANIVNQVKANCRHLSANWYQTTQGLKAKVSQSDAQLAFEFFLDKVLVSRFTWTLGELPTIAVHDLSLYQRQEEDVAKWTLMVLSHFPKPTNQKTCQPQRRSRSVSKQTPYCQ